MLRLVAGTKYEVLRYISTEIKIDFTNSGKKTPTQTHLKRVYVFQTRFLKKKTRLNRFFKNYLQNYFFCQFEQF
jgi:hypothetical protein